MLLMPNNNLKGQDLIWKELVVGELGDLSEQATRPAAAEERLTFFSCYSQLSFNLNLDSAY